jgi:glyoxylase-like metal-dependent hydrolase (beta-lactamase superfamily II)
VTDVARRPGDSAKAPRPPKQEQEPASEEITEVAPGVLRMQLPIWMPGLGHVNMYGLVDDRGLTVVDPGLPGPKSWRALKHRLKLAGYDVKDIHTVVVTHSHPDHFGGAGRIKKEANAELITHKAFTTWSLDRRGKGTLSEAETERLEQAAIDEADRYTGPSLEELPALRDDDASALDEFTEEHQRQSVPWGGTTPWGGSKHPMPALSKRVAIRAMRLVFAPPDPTRRVKHGAPIELAGRTWLAIHTPGHTLDHLCLYDPENGILLSGDHVLPSITPHIAGSGQGDALHSYLATLDLVASLDGVKLGLPAHGHPFDDVPGRVEAIKEHHYERMEKLRAASLALGPASVVTLSHELFPERHWGVMAESETFAHLEHLRGVGQAERWNEDGTLMYRVAAHT